MKITTLRITDIAETVARSLVRVATRNETARLSTPLLYPGGSMIGVELSRLRDGFLVSDAGGARREAGLMGGERTFARIARDVADRFGVRFDENMIFDMDVTEPNLTLAVIAVANAAKSAVEATAMQIATAGHADYQAHLWDRLERIYGSKPVRRRQVYRGSSDEWTFDAAVEIGQQLSLFEVVSPSPNAVNSAVTKFLDIRDLGEAAPHRIAVLTRRDATPHLPVLARTARIVCASDPDDVFRKAA
ncbi:hypothetical protein RA307_14920 [Xanthobacteraceae bacterium Astr-EGSB]|uniref:hypothetical protein n=1 Tax=Astrobacterium formosum TaxID=3069710 RepID=UPI0027B5BD3D|nr:hypothetical protein [Xanthobacteraceae bacterium Astr-EGSB]